jgi:hypothetical protein
MGASAGLMMASSTATQGVAAIGSAYSQSQATRSAGNYQNVVDQANAGMAGVESAGAIEQGNTAATNNDLQARAAIGSSRAASAAGGVDVGSGSAAATQGSIAAVGALDSLTIRNNAWRTSWGYQAQGLNASSAGTFAQQAGNNNANNTLLTGGMNAASSGMKAGYQFSQNGKSGMYVPSSTMGELGSTPYGDSTAGW